MPALLPDGMVLAPGGNGGGSTVELYDAGLAFDAGWQPQIGTITSPLVLGGSLTLTGSRFRGISGASGGNGQDSASDYPLVQLRNLDNGQTLFLLATNWSTNTFTSMPVSGLPPGYSLATVFVNGIPSVGSILKVSSPVPIPPILTGVTKQSDGSLRFTFTNISGASFHALATTNVALALSNWATVGAVTETASGQYQFIDLQATNILRRFYRVRSP